MVQGDTRSLDYGSNVLEIEIDSFSTSPSL